MKQDRKLLSKEKHEIAYVRKLAREWMNGAKRRTITDQGTVKAQLLEYISDAELKRICKAVLKFARYKK